MATIEEEVLALDVEETTPIASSWPRPESEFDHIRERLRSVYGVPGFIGDGTNWINKVHNAQRPLIELWGGWRWRSPVIEREVVSTATGKAIINEGINRFQYCTETRRCIYDYYDSTRTAEIDNRFPFPFAESPLWEARTHDIDLVHFWARNAPAIAVRKGQSVARAVLAHIKKTYKDRGQPVEREQYFRMWEYIFERLGQQWAASARLAKYTILLSVNPADWNSLGHVCGEGSCWRTGGEWQKSKYNVSQIPGAFCGFVYEDDGGEYNPCDGDTAEARFIGMHGVGCVAVSNSYFNNRETFGDASVLYDMVREQAQAAFNLDAPLVSTIQTSAFDFVTTHSWAYINGDTRLLVPQDVKARPFYNHTDSLRIAAYGARCGCGNYFEDDDDIGDLCENEDCGERICSSCRVTCSNCWAEGCRNCRRTYTCTGCEDTICADCLGNCSDCNTRYGACCLDDNNRCPACADYAESLENDTEPSPGSPRVREWVSDNTARISATGAFTGDCNHYGRFQHIYRRTWGRLPLSPDAIAAITNNERILFELYQRDMAGLPLPTPRIKPWTVHETAIYLTSEPAKRRVRELCPAATWLWRPYHRNDAIYDLTNDYLGVPSRRMLEETLFTIIGEWMSGADEATTEETVSVEEPNEDHDDENNLSDRCGDPDCIICHAY